MNYLLLHSSSIAFAVALLISINSRVSAALDKPLIQPPFPPGKIDQGLLDHLKPTKSTHDAWGAGWIPRDCKTLAEGAKFSANDIEVFNIHYTDCNDVWIMCRHTQSPMSQIDMIDLFGRMPVSMRGYVRHIIALPGTKSAFNNGDNIAIFGKGTDISLFVHETGHSLDSHAYDPKVTPFHDSAPWLEAFNEDSSVSDDYARTNQAENVAQETVISLFDKVVPGGIGTIQPNWRAIFHQYATLQFYLGKTLLPGGTCSNRLGNSPPVPKSASVEDSARLPTSPKPDVSLSNAVAVIPPTPMSAQYNITFWNDEPRPIRMETAWAAVGETDPVFLNRQDI
ncbi:MAG: hypothetical protein M1839_001467 [Geoglossum umbratile]|nr:MAG: hypothetical protein M1839_001467 [Geoglossum umbratile]